MSNTQTVFFSTNSICQTGIPIRITYAEAMNALLSDSSNVGKVFIYMGETNSQYTHGGMYTVVVE
ncbi:MAG: hypothetical protein IJO93_00605 [Clostridia bacterium]|nr:hypothetical protein [Clostridia bacterium]